jgi:hypothetical protein
VNVTQTSVVAAAGLIAGVINTVVGSGTLITFPILLSVGVAPVNANVANNIGLAPGSVSGAVGYRRELTGPTHRLIALTGAAITGGITGAILLLLLPSSLFQKVAPYLVGIAVVLVIMQPYLENRLGTFREQVSRGDRNWILPVATFSTSVYGGYFGAGQGIILLALMGTLMSESLQQINAIKNALQAVDNLTSAAIFALMAHVEWRLVAPLAIGSIIGGQIGARWGRRLSPATLRLVIVTIGFLGIVQLVRDR